MGSYLSTCEPRVGIKDSDKQLHPTDTVGCDYLSPPLTPASGSQVLGAVSIRKTVLPGMAIPMLKIRRPNGRLIFNMEITIRR